MSETENRSPEGMTQLVRPRFHIHTKVLSLVVVAALIPALLIAAASFLTARRILIEKAHAELSVRRDTALSVLRSWHEQRESEAGHFAQADIVTRGLADRSLTVAPSSSEVPNTIYAYLEMIQEREPLYHDFAVLDREGRSVARLRSDDLPSLRGTGSRFLRRSGSLEVLLHRAILGPEESEIGTFVAVRDAEDLWRAIHLDVAARWGTLTITTREGLQVYPLDKRDAASRPSPNHCGDELESAGVASYRGADGSPLRGAFAAEPGLGLCVLLEVAESEAFAAVNELRRQTALIVLVGVLLLAALGYVLARSLLRPVRALIDGAEAVEEGNLDHLVEVRSADEIGYLAQVFNHMTASLRRSYARLERLSTIDELTGLLNRRELNRRFLEKLDKARADDRPLAYLLFDIDHFKSINDHFGHRQGDEVLKTIANLLADTFDGSSEVGRWGGEEFVVLLADCDSADATANAEALREKLEETALRYHDASPLTVSVGIAIRPEHGEDEDDLLQAADEALYRAKQLGRNRVEIAVAGVTRSAVPESSR